MQKLRSHWEKNQNQAEPINKQVDSSTLILFSAAFTLTRGRDLMKLDYLHKLWTMEFTIVPRGYRSGWTNIILATNSGNEHSFGARIPGVFFKDMSTVLHICHTEIFPHKFMCPDLDHHELKMNQRTRVRIQQIPGYADEGQP